MLDDIIPRRRQSAVESKQLNFKLKLYFLSIKIISQVKSEDGSPHNITTPATSFPLEPTKDDQSSNSDELILLCGVGGTQEVGGEAEGGSLVGRPLLQH